MKFLALLLSVLLVTPALAQDRLPPEATNQTIEVTPAPDTSVTLAPPGCDFQITFPAPPYSSRRCPDDAGGRCYDLTRYTMVYDMSTTVDVRFSCNPLLPGQYDQYNEGVTRTVLNGMAARANVMQSRTNHTQEGEIRRTTVSGTGMTGRQEKIYVAQIWTSPLSILTMEAELIGGEHTVADTVFSDILRSVGMKKPPAEDNTGDATPPASDAPALP